MSTEPLSRREFLTTVGASVAIGVTTGKATACRRRRRACHYCPPCPLRVRQNIAALDDCQLESFKRGVAEMKALPETDPRSWQFQANIHGKVGPKTNPLFKQCEHGTLLFLAWHRGYLYFFERILRQAADDPNFSLPYWDWSTAPALPVAFRLPANSSNPLYDGSRFINDGSALPPQVVVQDLNKALNYIPFPPNGPVGFSRQLEGSPHGAVHVLVGGRMGSVPTAANDPIFWLHHCNIDRVWDYWLNLNLGRVNLSDPALLDKTYSFADESGAVVILRVRDMMSSAQFGYRYDNVPNPPLALVMSERRAVKRDETRGQIRVASSVGEKDAKAAKSKSLGFKSETVKLNIAKAHEATFREATEAAAAGRPRKILLQIEGLSFSEVPNFTYAVYLNLPEKELPADKLEQHYVGSINFFHDDTDSMHEHGGDKTFTETLDLVPVIARLRKAGDWKNDSFSVTLRPLTPIAPKGQEEDLRKRSEASAAKAKITYKRIDVVVAP